MCPYQSNDPQELMHQAGWTDGLSVVEPTPERVQWFIKYIQRDPEDSIGYVPPMGGKATVQKLAINSVMAGARPEYFPVILTAVEAMLDPRFNLHGVQCSTGIPTPLVIVNGPVIREINMNCGTGVFGQGNRANATIGRAVKLVQWNIGGARPGEADKKPFGHPGKYSFCIAENEEINPWEPYHVENGFNPDDSTVTVFASEAPVGVMGGTANGARVLERLADRMSSAGVINMSVAKFGDVFVCLGQDHAELLRDEGWSKEDVRTFLWQHARCPAHKLGSVRPSNWPDWIDLTDPDFMVPLTRRRENIKILVTGGPGGGQSVVLTGWGTRAITRKIEFPGQS